MLKQRGQHTQTMRPLAAAFGRLCVETSLPPDLLESIGIAAAFGRLCVETASSLEDIDKLQAQPPSGGCVLKLIHFVT